MAVRNGGGPTGDGEAREPGEVAPGRGANPGRPGGLRPWLPLPEEGAAAYEAARCYFELRGERSLTKVAQKCGKNQSLISRWSREWGWVERARAYDLRMARVEHRAREAAVATQAEQCERRRAELREREWQAAGTLHRLAEKILARQEKYDHVDYKLGDAAALLKRASELAHRATEAPGDS